MQTQTNIFTVLGSIQEITNLYDRVLTTAFKSLLTRTLFRSRLKTSSEAARNSVRLSAVALVGKKRERKCSVSQL